MNSIKFYGKRKREEDDKYARLQDGDERLSEKVQFSVLHPSSKKLTFAKQASALDYRGEDISQTIFSWEYSTGGVRQFLVTSPQSFWQFYKHETRRHYYEVIAENFPCKLYLDIEFKTEENPDKDGDSLVDRLLTSIFQFANKKLNLNLIKDDVLILDSTSETKFSNHLIFTTLVFADNFQAGRFIDDFLSNLTSEESALFKVKKGEEEIWMIDTAVYTKNRNFRLFLSSKYGRKEILDVSENDLFNIKLLEENYSDPKFDRERSIFLHSLVTVVDDLPVVEYSPLQGVLEVKERRSVARQQGRARNKQTEQAGSRSPYPEVDRFILGLVEPMGFIRKWKMSEDGNSVTYEIGGNRYCANISREHKSNNIKYVCCFETETVYQRCHDPICRDFRGPEISLPEDVIPWKGWTDLDLTDEPKS